MKTSKIVLQTEKPPKWSSDKIFLGCPPKSSSHLLTALGRLPRGRQSWDTTMQILSMARTLDPHMRKTQSIHDLHWLRSSYGLCLRGVSLLHLEANFNSRRSAPDQAARSQRERPLPARVLLHQRWIMLSYLLIYELGSL